MWMKCKGKKWMALLLCIITATGLTGCGSEAQEEDYLIVEQQEEPITYTLGTVTMGDVEKTLRISCVYQQLHDEEVCFQVSGKKISKVYVKEGDIVKKGQLLAELSGGSLQDEINRLEYQITRNNILLEQTLADKKNEIDLQNQYFELWTKQSWDDVVNLRDALSQIEKNYAYAIEDYQDAIALDQKQIQSLKSEAAQSNLYAGMSGTISYIMDNLEGSTCAKDKVVMKIIDSTECLFAVDEPEYTSYFTEGTGVDLNINTGTASGNYIVYPYQIKNWTDTLLFSLSDEGDIPTIEVGTTGMLRMVLEQKTQVLTVPISAVHNADGKAYVYVLGENNLREVQWITAGLYGDDTVEVIDGLSEGDTVITR
ncbi:MAG TPA: biotin/lipoyl-binding protein [Lachnospiraceae bacterium]|nr:biotin/lipoyl-binding protein [Lachnospiraceae bacterium]